MPETGSAERLERSVGPYLKEVRESKGIGLEEAASVTRIGKNYLLAIEEEAFDKLPSAVYIKGFLRVYAGYLGLSGDEVVAMYDKSRTSQQSSSRAMPTSMNRSGRIKLQPQIAAGGWPLFSCWSQLSWRLILSVIKREIKKRSRVPRLPRSQVATPSAPVHGPPFIGSAKTGACCCDGYPGEPWLFLRIEEPRQA